jgi:dTMP kinase
MFVTIEGIEGSGKSTLLSGLASRLSALGRKVFVTRQPGGTAVGIEIRKIVLAAPGAVLAPTAEALLMAADRAQHVAESIAPQLAAGTVVLCDRYTDSTIAYQGYGRGLDVTALTALNEIATGGLHPDLTFLIDIPVDVSRRRIMERMGELDRMEAEGVAFHERVRDGFLKIAALSPRFHVLDGTLEPQALIDLAMSAIERSLAE